jgi:hypothetical protein
LPEAAGVPAPRDLVAIVLLLLLLLLPPLLLEWAVGEVVRQG